MSAEEYRELIETRVRPLYREFQRRSVEEGLITARVAYGWYRAFSRGDTLMVEDGGARHEFPFPRRAEPPRYCIADFFKTEAEGGDVAGFFVVTIGVLVFLFIVTRMPIFYAHPAYKDSSH